MQKLLAIKYDNNGFPIGFNHIIQQDVKTKEESEQKNILFYGKFSIENYTYTDEHNIQQTAKNFNCNLYLNLHERSEEPLKIRVQIQNEEQLCFTLLKEKLKEEDMKKRVKSIFYFKLIVHHKTLKDENGKVLKDKEGNKITKPAYSFEKNENKIAKDHAKAGYFAFVAYKVEGDALQHLKTYKFGDEQEKYFFTMTVKKSNNLSRK